MWRLWLAHIDIIMKYPCTVNIDFFFWFLEAKGARSLRMIVKVTIILRTYLQRFEIQKLQKKYIMGVRNTLHAFQTQIQGSEKFRVRNFNKSHLLDVSYSALTISFSPPMKFIVLALELGYLLFNQLFDICITCMWYLYVYSRSCQRFLQEKLLYHVAMTSQQLGRSKCSTTHQHKELQVCFSKHISSALCDFSNWSFILSTTAAFSQGQCLHLALLPFSDRSNSSQIASRFLPVITIGDAIRIWKRQTLNFSYV